MKKIAFWTASALALTLPLSLASSAQADVYHPVSTGDTLATIAAKYHVTADVLRSVNKLSNYGDRDVLPTMLLRVPEDDKSLTPSTNYSAAMTPRVKASETATRYSAPSTNSAVVSTASNLQGASGSISKSFLYTVQPGDTLESIAEKHTEYGYPVTVQAIRAKNANTETLTAGRTLIIPVSTLRLSAQVTGSSSTTASIPQKAIETPPATQAPLYEVVGSQPKGANKSASSARRGPTALGSRSYIPSQAGPRSGTRLDGARVLGDGEVANVTGTPLSRMRSRTVQPTAAPRPVNPTAEVARISLSGARIRRLPDASAVTLYNCARGTELAVTKRNGEWSAILMSDRSTGWIPTRYLSFTGQSVDVSTQVIANVENTREVSVRSADGRWSSSNPFVAQALTWLGTPYVYGGESRRGIDCSAMIQNSFRACGVNLPRTAAQQARVGMAVQPADLQPGDRLYFSASGTRIDHTGLYMGNGLFVHASGRGRSVIVSRLYDKFNWNIFVGARR